MKELRVLEELLNQITELADNENTNFSLNIKLDTIYTLSMEAQSSMYRLRKRFNRVEREGA